MDTGRRAARCRAILFAAGVLCAAAGCARERKDLGAIERAYAAGRYEDAAALCDRSIRKGEADGDVYYFSGASLLALGKDADAGERFREAIRSDSALSARVARALTRGAAESLKNGTAPRAALLARAAAEIDRDAVAAPLGYLVAASYFEERNWAEAAFWYSGALSAHPDTAAAETALFRLAACRAALGDTAAAIEALEAELGRFARGELADRAAWALSEFLYGRARAEFERGEYGAAILTAERVASESPDPPTAQKAMFLVGESYERMGEFERAYAQFEAIAEQSRGAPGDIAERARAKMRGFSDAGLR
jgi:tetratricopeptide (TPR) repeat protein